MAPAVDDYDESYDALDDALNEELSAIESDLIRLNSRSWPKPEDGEDARGARRFRDGAEAERAEVEMGRDIMAGRAEQAEAKVAELEDQIAALKLSQKADPEPSDKKGAPTKAAEKKTGGKPAAKGKAT